MHRDSRILFVGPLPPPVHGFSVINQVMLDKLRERSKVANFSRTHCEENFSTSLPHSLRRICAVLLFFRLLLNAARLSPKILYLGLSGGYGQVFDLIVVLIARFYRINVYIHHHSFAYLNSKSAIASILFKSATSSKHIVLCAKMAQQLESVYGVSSSAVVVLSNAAFQYPLQSVEASTTKEQGLIIGFLSNITKDKGIFEFIQVLRLLKQHGIQFRAEVAGPLDKNIASIFMAAVSELPELVYLGPAYGASKQEFFGRTDILLFPSNYANEAEPVTILEAQESGCYVVASRRGCIPTMLAPPTGSSLDFENFVADALEVIKTYCSLSHSTRQELRYQTRKLALDSQCQSKRILENLLLEICGEHDSR